MLYIQHAHPLRHPSYTVYVESGFVDCKLLSIVFVYSIQYAQEYERKKKIKSWNEKRYVCTFTSAMWCSAASAIEWKRNT